MARERQDASIDRRELLKTVGAAALLGAAPGAATDVGAGAASQPASGTPSFAGMPQEGPGRPKICLGAGANLDDAGMRRLKQIGVNNVLMGGGNAPWDEAALKARMDRFKANGLAICNMMITGFEDVIHGGPKAEEQTAAAVSYTHLTLPTIYSV